MHRCLFLLSLSLLSLSLSLFLTIFSSLSYSLTLLLLHGHGPFFPLLSLCASLLLPSLVLPLSLACINVVKAEEEAAGGTAEANRRRRSERNLEAMEAMGGDSREGAPLAAGGRVTAASPLCAVLPTDEAGEETGGGCGCSSGLRISAGGGSPTSPPSSGRSFGAFTLGHHAPPSPKSSTLSPVDPGGASPGGGSLADGSLGGGSLAGGSGGDGGGGDGYAHPAGSHDEPYSSAGIDGLARRAWEYMGGGRGRGKYSPITVKLGSGTDGSQAAALAESSPSDDQSRRR